MSAATSVFSRHLAVGALLVAGSLGSTGGALAQGPAAGGAAMATIAALTHISGFKQALLAEIGDDAALAGFYRERGYQPYWTVPEAQARLGLVLDAFGQASKHGLPEGRYDPQALAAEFAGLRSEGDRARLDVRVSRALLQFARDLNSGVLEPGRVVSEIKREVTRPERSGMLARFDADPEGFLAGLAPRHPEYARLLKARAALVAQIERDGWGPQVGAKALRPGASGAEVVALRDRLMRMGYMGRSATQSYDGALTAAVQSFQIDHGLPADGEAGEATLRQINIEPASRLRALTVALERERWLNKERGARHIWVNLADFTAKIVDDGKVTFETRAVIGAVNDDKQTPEFSHRMTYMELNPDWTVPRGIIRRDYLPRLQRNPGALAHLQVVDSRGRVVPRSQVDFSAYTANNFPFNLRQPPGRSNALGLVKFMFPNPWAIYLHDSPEKHLFVRDARAYSSGCVRLNDPFDFAYALLARQESDPRAAFHRVLGTNQQSRINLVEPVQIHLEYRTAFTTPKGRVQYRSDIYGRDQAIHAALLRAGVAVPGEAG